MEVFIKVQKRTPYGPSARSPMHRIKHVLEFHMQVRNRLRSPQQRFRRDEGVWQHMCLAAGSIDWIKSIRYSREVCRFNVGSRADATSEHLTIPRSWDSDMSGQSTETYYGIVLSFPLTWTHLPSLGNLTLRSLGWCTVDFQVRKHQEYGDLYPFSVPCKCSRTFSARFVFPTISFS